MIKAEMKVLVPHPTMAAVTNGHRQQYHPILNEDDGVIPTMAPTNNPHPILPHHLSNHSRRQVVLPRHGRRRGGKGVGLVVTSFSGGYRVVVHVAHVMVPLREEIRQAAAKGVEMTRIWI